MFSRSINDKNNFITTLCIGENGLLKRQFTPVQTKKCNIFYQIPWILKSLFYNDFINLKNKGLLYETNQISQTLRTYTNDKHDDRRTAQDLQLPNF
jgi:hypothetical protein